MNEINCYTFNQVELQINHYFQYFATLAVTTLPGAGCSQCSRPVWQQRLRAGQRHGDEAEGQQVVVPVQLRQRVHVTRHGKLRLTGVVVKRHLGGVRPKVNASARIPEGQRLFASRHVEAHEQLAHCIDVKDICHVSETGGFAELALTWRKERRSGVLERYA